MMENKGHNIDGHFSWEFSRFCRKSSYESVSVPMKKVIDCAIQQGILSENDKMDWFIMQHKNDENRIDLVCDYILSKDDITRKNLILSTRDMYHWRQYLPELCERGDYDAKVISETMHFSDSVMMTRGIENRPVVQPSYTSLKKRKNSTYK